MPTSSPRSAAAEPEGGGHKNGATLDGAAAELDRTTSGHGASGLYHMESLSYQSASQSYSVCGQHARCHARLPMDSSHS